MFIALWKVRLNVETFIQSKLTSLSWKFIKINKLRRILAPVICKWLNINRSFLLSLPTRSIPRSKFPPRSSTFMLTCSLLPLPLLLLFYLYEVSQHSLTDHKVSGTTERTTMIILGTQLSFKSLTLFWQIESGSWFWPQNPFFCKVLQYSLKKTTF